MMEGSVAQNGRKEMKWGHDDAWAKQGTLITVRPIH